MVIKPYSPELDPSERRARLSTEHSASSYGQPVLVLETGEALSQSDVLLGDYRVVEATDQERADLARAGYLLADA